MSNIEVKAHTIPEILKRLNEGEWLAPNFQREFVWTHPQIMSLIASVLDSKPIGMATLWEQEEKSDLPLEHISVRDWIQEDSKTGPRYYGNNESKPGRFYAILDGKQRSTALAIAFGGLSATGGKYKFSGAYFLNIHSDDAQEKIKYYSHIKINELGLNCISKYVMEGLFPLTMDDPHQMIGTWMNYMNSIDNTDHYPEGNFPTKEERDKNKSILQDAFTGISSTKLAVYIVPKEETLGEICDIFETLNTTGTKVSTIDLIHSWVYSETINDPDPISLRNEIETLGDLDGALGWASIEKRPELVAQILACIQISLDKKRSPRPVSGKKITEIKSIKSSDLLAISSMSWRDFFDQKEFIAKCFLDFQESVAGGRFSMAQCPYPGIISVYIALRWYLKFDSNDQIYWTKVHLNKLFTAFFWRNSLSQRYDQGFLTRVGSDVSLIKNFLNKKVKKQKESDWEILANDWLENLDRMKTSEELDKVISQALSDGNTKGALSQTVNLLLYSRAREDVVDPTLTINNLYDTLQLHHIYPKNWCSNNITESNEKYTKRTKEGIDWVDSTVNLMPLHSTSNRQWAAKEPSMAITELEVHTEAQFNLLKLYFIDKKALGYLSKGSEGIGDFFNHRKKLIKSEIEKMLVV